MERKREGDDDEGRKEREGGQCAARRARGREGERRGGEKKKEKASGKGETWRTHRLPIDAGAFESGAWRSADT